MSGQVYVPRQIGCPVRKNVWTKARRDGHVTAKLLRIHITFSYPWCSTRIFKNKKGDKLRKGGSKEDKRANQTNSTFSEQDDVQTSLNPS